MNSVINRIAILFLMGIVAGCGGSGAFLAHPVGDERQWRGNHRPAQRQLGVDRQCRPATTSISVDSPGTLKATVIDENGSPVAAGHLRCCPVNPTAGSVLTNASGVATVTLVAGTTTGADTVTANATINGGSASATKGYTVAAPSVSLSITIPPTSPLSAMGTTSLTVTVLDGAGAPYTTPVDIDFSSGCSASGKATIVRPSPPSTGSHQ